MNVILPFIDALAEVVKMVWPDLADPVFRMTQIERRNWLDDIENKTLHTPYCVIEIPEKTKSENGPVSGNCWDLTPTIYYIAAEKDGDGNIADLIESRLEALSDALIYPFQAGVTFSYTVYDAPSWSTSGDEAVNRAMLEKQLPFLSGALTFTALVGFVNTP